MSSAGGLWWWRRPGGGHQESVDDVAQRLHSIADELEEATRELRCLVTGLREVRDVRMGPCSREDEA